jgi:hypothetical protein
MIRKFYINRNQKTGDFTIEERAVVDPMPRGITTNQLNDGNYSLIYRKTYSCNKIESAAEKGTLNLMDAIRNSYFFPVEEHCTAIGDSILHILDSGEGQAELVFDSCEIEEKEASA